MVISTQKSIGYPSAYNACDCSLVSHLRNTAMVYILHIPHMRADNTVTLK